MNQLCFVSGDWKLGHEMRTWSLLHCFLAIPCECWLELMTSDRWTDRQTDRCQSNSIDPRPLAAEGKVVTGKIYLARDDLRRPWPILSSRGVQNISVTIRSSKLEYTFWKVALDELWWLWSDFDHQWCLKYFFCAYMNSKYTFWKIDLDDLYWPWPDFDLPWCP